MISQLTFFLFSMSSSTGKNHLKSAKILVNRNEKSNSFLGMTSRTCCNLIGCWGMANLFSSNLAVGEKFLFLQKKKNSNCQIVFNHFSHSLLRKVFCFFSSKTTVGFNLRPFSDIHRSTRYICHISRRLKSAIFI